MPAPIMARISAYSAAEAPDSSLIILTKFFIVFLLGRKPPVNPAYRLGCVRLRAPPKQRPQEPSAGRRSRRPGDAASGLAHRGRDRGAEVVSGNRDARADNGEDQRIFCGRSTRLVLQHRNEILHGHIPSLKTKSPRAPFARHGFTASRMGGTAMLIFRPSA